MLRRLLTSPKEKQSYRWQLILALPLWVLVGFFLSNFILAGAITLLKSVGVSFEAANGAVVNTLLAVIIYALSLAIVIGVPWLVKKRRTSTEDLGISRWPSWLDIALAPAALIVYFIFSHIFLSTVEAVIPGINLTEAQNVGFNNLTEYYEVILAFITLVLLAPVAEELLFRGYLYGKLRKSVPIWAAALVTSAAFGFVHGQWNVAIDVFVLSLVACMLREMTGGIWAGILLHAMKNGIAFYLLFINPALLTTMGA